MDGRDLSLLHSLAYFVDVEISKRRAAEELRFLACAIPSPAWATATPILPRAAP